ncbi:MAG: hypothetical protein FRX48_03949 [Lasallia pustulata]|uniref:Integral membrane n=1 Tax=Lasallia pustulata TaxID=136370 RepID=A0A5M8PQJ3_9LECA|nr:MAG: hypothetical protein FRX48_03949 [Lasallia pustulata]
MACTIVRISGLILNGKIDFQWETYWLSIQANVGIIMTAITAFRTFFISRSNERAQLPGGRGLRWYTQSTQAFRRILTPWSWRPMSATKISAGSSNEEIMELPRTSRATMTGVRTFINGPENSAVAGSQLTRSAVREENEGIWPLPEQGQDSGSIKVQHDVSVTSESIHATRECV